jgi:dTDP-4-amino-4,6-dideoxygalactose transaminase
MIPFHRQTHYPGELQAISANLSGEVPDGHFNAECGRLLRARLGVLYSTLTPSCTHALELAALTLDISPGDEVIVPSFTFTSTANAFLLRGARLVFADVLPTTQNIDPNEVKRLVTPRTRAIVVVHYAGIACDMEAILAIARPAGIAVVEDAAHALFGEYRGRPLGTIGDIGAFSFHSTKNITCGEGGGFVTNDPEIARAAEIIREKGTNRTDYFNGKVSKYEWLRAGSSLILADLLAAQLFAQLAHVDEIQTKREQIFRRYQTGLAEWATREGVRQPFVPADCNPAWHLYYLVLPSEAVRDRLVAHLGAQGIGSATHYLPLHLTPAGKHLGGKVGEAPVAEEVAVRLLRLPMYTDLSDDEQDRVIEVLHAFGSSPSVKAPRSSACGIA